MDAEEFTAFFRAVHPGLARYVTRLTDTDAADEICAETMTTLWLKRLPAPADEVETARLRSLAYRVAEGHVRNRRRGDRRRSSLVRKVVALTPPVDEPDLADRILVDDDASRRLRELRLADREVIALVVDGYTMAEIAVVLDCSVGAVKMRVMRARRALRALMDREVDRADSD